MDHLDDAGSFLRFEPEEHRLIRRVDASAQQAFDRALEDSPVDTEKLLRSAWVHAYGLHPDPDKAYGEAVKAVEDVLSPLGAPDDKVRTLGKALGNIKSQVPSGKWELAIGDQGDQKANIERFVGMVELLHKNQLSRHAGGHNSRSQKQHEAEAALHLAILIVQWVNTNVLKKA
ncbi:hypothetical protein KGD82_11135 [Nocardiopsis eucommiae]|uniref:Uncharacterized protein n=1 Tax=Nocardiopsis eucommiae TaxID=2831970 RepID=A0A975LCS8_9ACTN|nr:hypothetical protein KGD82_11135 [Nocardiopsis eucommiae]